MKPDAKKREETASAEAIQKGPGPVLRLEEGAVREWEPLTG